MSRLAPPSEPSMRHSASFEAFGNINLDSGFTVRSSDLMNEGEDFDSGEFDDDEFAASDFVSTNMGDSRGFSGFSGGGFNVETINMDEDEEPTRSRSPTGSFIEFSRVDYDLDPDSIGTSLDDFDDTAFTTLEEEAVVPTGSVSNGELQEIKSETPGIPFNNFRFSLHFNPHFLFSHLNIPFPSPLMKPSKRSTSAPAW